MNIEAILTEPQKYLGQTVELEGYFIGLREGSEYQVYLGSDARISDAHKQQIRIAQSFDELKSMIRPLPLLQLLYRGTLTNPPYYYRFPIRLTARIELDNARKPVLQEISSLELEAPYSGKMAELTPYSSYEYSATIDYAPQREPQSQQPAKARISIQRHLLFKDKAENPLALATDENRYARWLIGQDLCIAGWLKFLQGTKNGEAQFVLHSYSVRASMVAVGPLKEMTIIWLRPSPLYDLLRAHMTIYSDAELNQRVDIIGKIDYLQDEAAPIASDSLPKLVFTEVSAVTIYEEGYLLEA